MRVKYETVKNSNGVSAAYIAIAFSYSVTPLRRDVNLKSRVSRGGPLTVFAAPRCAPERRCESPSGRKEDVWPSGKRCVRGHLCACVAYGWPAPPPASPAHD